jgi:hypothetical protein
MSLLRHRVQILSFIVVPLISVFTFTRLGFHVRRVWFLAWLTLLPVTVCFPQISQVRDIFSFLKKPGWAIYWTCSVTLLVTSQVWHFFGLDFFKVSPAKMRFYIEVIQKLKFPNNSILLIPENSKNVKPVSEIFTQRRRLQANRDAEARDFKGFCFPKTFTCASASLREAFLVPSPYGVKPCVAVKV